MVDMFFLLPLLNPFDSIYLTTRFLKTQLFYLLFIKPSFFRPSKNKYHAKIAAKRFQNGKNMPVDFIFFAFWLFFIIINTHFVFVNVFQLDFFIDFFALFLDPAGKILLIFA